MPRPEPASKTGRGRPPGAPSLDLGPALRDGWLRRVLLGPGGEPAELGIHRMRYVVDEGEPEDTRLVGLRLRGVVALASEALGHDEDEERWERAHVDWVGALTFSDAMPPVVTSALLGADETLPRFADAAEDLLWHRGDPNDVQGLMHAPILLEVTAEGVLPTGQAGRVRLFAAAQTIEVRDRRGPSSLEEMLGAGERFDSAWRAYWKARHADPSLEDDLAFAWLLPEEG